MDLIVSSGETRTPELDINELGPVKKKKKQIVADEAFRSPYVCILSFELELLPSI